MNKWIIPIIVALATLGCHTKPRALIVVGGHDFDTTEFFDVFESLEGVDFETVYHPDAVDMLGDGSAEKFDLLIFYDFVPDLPKKDSAIFLDLTMEGIPMLFLHHSLCTFQEWDGYMEMVGGRYVMVGFGADSTQISDYKHDIDLMVQVKDKNHPITRGVEDFTIHDEGYSNITVLDQVTPLLASDHPDSSPIIGWAHTCNKSQVVYLMLGHDRYAYEHHAFRQLIDQAVHWLAETRTETIKAWQ